jgi:hypothetical protein
MGMKGRLDEKSSMIELVNLWVPLALLGLIILAAIFFSRSS